ncbi:MAG TPA: sigma-70 family RNA polymerase sigma factor [Actinophytocola sp.]|uniref:sigma-70 family RNA polymerase sigma factor n=1 Tax=Actinophytocola sp. TaxID=1872138 RepID=UPI002DB62D8F|nr:sigma-70 family RNA polymerase sigma factor [Actinophytocola sp.]HEU5472612.1 sigma-70 family RNA polymerase sigma factor [Actinophytocola sp.]
MDESQWLADRFEENRAHLRAVAYRMLGSAAEAEDAVQDAWLRLRRSDTSEVNNLGGWLTTVVARICLNMLQSRRTRREEPLGSHEPPDAADPEGEAVLADSVGMALLVVLDTLPPAERLAFVLHDLFAVPFDEIAPIVERTPAAARQLASRARRRVRGASAPATDLARRRRIVDAFLAASRGGDFDALLALLDPDVLLRADPPTVAAAAARQAAGAPQLAPEIRGAAPVADAFAGRARNARPALIDGLPGAVWAPDGTPRVAFLFTLTANRITAINMLSDPDTLHDLDIQITG